MKSASGGLLWVFEHLGGLVIFLLVGKRAWNHSSTAIGWRLVIGSMFLGVPVGIAVSSVWPAFLFMIVGVALKALSKSLTDERNDVYKHKTVIT